MSYVSCGVSNSINTVAPQGGHALHRRPAGDAEACYVTRGEQKKDKQASKQQLSEPDQAIHPSDQEPTLPSLPPPSFFLSTARPPIPAGIYTASAIPLRARSPRAARCAVIRAYLPLLSSAPPTVPHRRGNRGHRRLARTVPRAGWDGIWAVGCLAR